MAETLQRRTCANHRDRPAFASCKACRKPICQECAAEWDGIQHCPECLAKRRRRARASGPWREWLPVVVWILAVAAALPTVVGWTVALMGSVLS
jgi:hypothetical protein